MTLNPWAPKPRAPTAPAGSELIADHRARLEHDRLVALERRQHDLAEQSSTLNTPEARIRMWEKVHEIELPRDPKHRLLSVIARGTELTLDQVLAEQRQRALPPQSVPAAVATALPE